MSDEHEARMAEFESRLDAMSQRLDKSEEQNRWLEEELKKRDEHINELEHALNQLQTRTDLLDSIEQGSALRPEQRAAVLIQTLHNEAVNTNGHASIDASGAVKALGGSVDRTLMYGETGTFQKAVELINDEDVIDLKRENRSSEKNTRLRLDLSEGDVPQTVAGVEIKGGASD